MKIKLVLFCHSFYHLGRKRFDFATYISAVMNVFKIDKNCAVILAILSISRQKHIVCIIIIMYCIILNRTVLSLQRR